MKNFLPLVFLTLISFTNGFNIQNKLNNFNGIKISVEESFDPLNVQVGLDSKITLSDKKSLRNVVSSVASSAVLSFPFAAIAEEYAPDDYEYGAVDAPIGLAWGAGLLAVLTALLPLALQGGEEAFEEMRQNDADSFGKNKDVLNKRK
eukprot:CAMPEP_0184855150 /NCGR_PEP_ID=MMETSP0580-20130426/464_1 /TAXON_ID=1118495 /ORGANISM="Dactyliosolen fragilissimus" /LENGTH=147 /DNA_ID=CAMNT_0027349591 /DNA_START=64 /DNA_END=507 /DNA_ORIENTATION=-